MQALTIFAVGMGVSNPYLANCGQLDTSNLWHLDYIQLTDSKSLSCVSVLFPPLLLHCVRLLTLTATAKHWSTRNSDLHPPTSNPLPS
jgi:hypothetical protein